MSFEAELTFFSKLLLTDIPTSDLGTGAPSDRKRQEKLSSETGYEFGAR